MAFFTQKQPILEENALIGTADGMGGIDWEEVYFDYAWELFCSNVLEDRGYRVVNGIRYNLFYLPSPTDSS